MLFVFIICVPLIMCLFGRYKPYYSWMFYVPALLFLVNSLKKLEAKYTYSFLSYGLLFSILSIGVTIYKNTESRNDLNVLKSYFADKQAEKVLLMDNYLSYYYLYQNRNLYFVSNLASYIETNTANIGNGKFMLTYNYEGPNFWVEGLTKEKPNRKLPSSGICVVEKRNIVKLQSLKDFKNLHFKEELEMNKCLIFKYDVR